MQVWNIYFNKCCENNLYIPRKNRENEKYHVTHAVLSRADVRWMLDFPWTKYLFMFA